MINPVYANFQQAEQQLNELLPVDYFLAQEVTSALVSAIEQQSENVSVQSHHQQILFHAIIALSQSVQQGHTCLPLTVIANTRFGFASDPDGNISKQGYLFPTLTELLSALSDFKLAHNDDQLLVLSGKNLYLRRYYLFEQEVNQELRKRIVNNTLYSTADIEKVLTLLFPQTSTDVESKQEIDWQKVAVANAINKNFSVIAGGPGTGKTYTVTKLLAALVMLEQSVKQENQATNADNTRYALVAPTGKAAQRLSESIQQAVQQFSGVIDEQVLAQIPTEALTIHRLLGYIPNSPNFRHHQNNLLAIDFLLIDEASMVDLALLTRIFRALPEHCKIVLLGDADQLPAVAVGNVLADIAPRPHPGVSKTNAQYLKAVTGFELIPVKKCAADHLTFLMKSRRFDGEGGIGKLAKAVIAGDSQTSWQLLTESTTRSSDSQVQLLSVQSENNSPAQQKQNSHYLADFIRQYYMPLFRSNSISEAFTVLHQFRILCATRKGPQGVEFINEQVLQYFQTRGLITSQQGIFHAMPILITENHHKLGIYNGDVGIIWRNSSGHLMAMFENSNETTGYKSIIPSRLPKYESVYAMTIHKTQGSEFSNVLMVLPENSDNKLLSRELLYTGITRAKQHIAIVSQANVWRYSVENKVVRYSHVSISTNE